MKKQFIPKCLVKVDESNRVFSGINGSRLNVVGIVTLNVAYDNYPESGVCVYVVSNDTMSIPIIIGRDILRKHNISPVNEIENIGIENEIEILNIDICESDSLSESLIVNPAIDYGKRKELKEIFAESYLQEKRPIKLKVSAELKLQLRDVKAFHISPRRFAYIEKEQLRKILDDLLAKEIIRKSESEYASPVVLIPKKTGEYRLCVDYRILNKYIVRDNYPIPVIEDQLNILRNKKYFSILDLKNGFYHISVSEESRQYTSFVTRFGQFEFLKMPFGLKTAPTRFQRFVNEVLDDLIRTGDVLVYIDDFLIATETLKHHMDILKRVFKVLAENKLELRIDKCKFLFNEIDYLGYTVTFEGIKPTDKGVKAVSEFPVPQSIRSVKSFLGLCSYFRKFIEGFAEIARPLHNLLKKDAIFKFTEDELSAFEKLKSKLVAAPILAIYDPHDSTELHCDASSFGFGAVLAQRKSNHKLHSVFYFSKRTTPAESKYHSFELETLAIIYALKQFRIYLLGIPFKILTDCNALKLTLQKKDINPRIARWVLELQSFDYTVEHRSGERMKHVDALSRSFSICVVEDNPFEYNLSICQSKDEKFKNYVNN